MINTKGQKPLKFLQRASKSQKDLQALESITTNKELVQLLQKDTLLRDEEDISKMTSSLCSIQFFKNIVEKQKQGTFENCCQFMQYLAIPKDTVLFKQGQTGDNFYIILSGQISININSKRSSSKTIQQSITNAKPDNSKIIQANKQIYNQVTVEDSNEDEDDDEDSDSQENKEFKVLDYEKRIKQDQIKQQLKLQNQKEQKKKPKQSIFSLLGIKRQSRIMFHSQTGTQLREQQCMQVVKVLNKGDSFGEMALLQPDLGTRMGSAISEEYTELAYLTKDDYQRILKDIDEENIIQHIRFYQEFPIFKGITYNYAQRLYMGTEYMTYHKDQVVYKQGSYPEYVYFIREGSFQVSMIKQYTKEEIEQKQKNQILPSTYKQDINKNFKKNIDISILGANQMFGHFELNQEISMPRQYTVKSQGVGHLYRMSKKNFKQFCNDPKFYEKLQKQIQNQHGFHLQNSGKVYNIIEKNKSLIIQDLHIKSRQIKNEEIQAKLEKEKKKQKLEQLFLDKKRKNKKNKIADILDNTTENNNQSMFNNNYQISPQYMQHSQSTSLMTNSQKENNEQILYVK